MTRQNPSSHARRKFLLSAAGIAAAPFAPTAGALALPDDPLPSAFTQLKPLGSRVVPIAPEEFRARIAKAQQLLASSSPKLDAIFIAPGTSLYYFSGVHWWPSERLLALLITKTGDPIFICAAFEEGRLREQLRYPADIRVWQEDESPTQLAAKALADRGLRTGRIGVEESTFFTFYDHLRAAAPSLEYVSADAITIACRAVKSEHELALMRLACEATCDVFRATFASVKPGMSQYDIGALISSGFSKMNLRGDALVLIGTSAALPHGSLKPQTLKDGEVILIDGGCKVEGYESDVTRTGVLGKPSEKVQRVFEIVRKAQDAALNAAQAGKLSGSVDDAARAVIASSGYGPGYKFLTHRLGHGIGLDGHEHPYLVKGSTTVLQPGMTFSNEPGIYIPGEFGLRLEEVMAITPSGPAQLLTPGFEPSLEKPLG